VTSETQLPSEETREYIMAKCLAKPVEIVSESKAADEDASESKE
jgi:hypothetical protein